MRPNKFKKQHKKQKQNNLKNKKNIRKKAEYEPKTLNTSVLISTII